MNHPDMVTPHRSPVRVTDAAASVGLLMLVLLSSTSCATNPQTAAAATAGGLAVIGLGAQALTRSALEVKVDAYMPTESEASRLVLTRAAVARRRADAASDVLAQPTIAKLQEVQAELKPKMERMNQLLPRIASAQQAVEEWARTAASTNTKAVDSELTTLLSRIRAAVQEWTAFDAELSTAARNGAQGKSGTLAARLGALRKVLRDIAAYQPSAEYLKLVRIQVASALRARQDKGALSEENWQRTVDAIDADMGRALNAFPAGPDAVRHLTSALNNSIAKLPVDRRAGFQKEVDTQLDRYGLSVDAPVIAAAEAAQSAVAATYSSLISEANLGLIRDEALQVLMTLTRELSLVTDPAGEARWRQFARARSEGGQGNLDTIIYLENMGTPLVKSSAFDPTKFVVAHGALYRRAFSAMTAVTGVPLPTDQTKAGDPVGVNLISATARVDNAKREEQDLRKRVIEAMGNLLDDSRAVDAAEGQWAQQGAAVNTKLKRDIEALAAALEAKSGSSK